MPQGIEEAIFSMYRRVLKIEYSLLLENYRTIIHYAAKTSDSFSIITEQIKPYGVTPPKCKHDAFLAPIYGCLDHQIVGAKTWPGTNTSAKHMVMNLYRMTKVTQKWLDEIPNPFLLCDNKPQDICFYRKAEALMYAVTHENEAVVVNPTDEDIRFFSQFEHRPF